MTVSQAAMKTGVSRERIIRAVLCRRLKGWKSPLGGYLLDPEDVDRWAATLKSTAPERPAE